ncbi:MAG: hypothetical protein MUC75_06140 [Ignavibacteriaceae bacterium]|jgi:hypothetical protein|nr:hypothetical protein [Ignavibacteriaceae bacterium]
MKKNHTSAPLGVTKEEMIKKRKPEGIPNLFRDLRIKLKMLKQVQHK